MIDPDPKVWRPTTEEPGVGMRDDGTLDVVTPEEHARRAMERDAEESLEDGREVDDLSAAYEATGPVDDDA